MFDILIFIHEFGHFISAKKCGVAVKEFSIGMGPKIIGWHSKKSETVYSIRLVPFGGYVSMVGEDEESERNDSFAKKSVKSRLLIVSSGAMMNLLLGFIVSVIIVVSAGALGSNMISYNHPDLENAISCNSGLQSGDVIIKVGRTPVHTWTQVNYEIGNKGYEPIDITVKRDGQKIVIEDVVFPTTSNMGVVLGKADFYPVADDFNLLNIIKHSFYNCVSTVKMVIDSLIGLISGRYGIKTVSGPVGITQTINDYASHGFLYFLNIVAIISINLGVLNLLPVPGLDGGRILFLLIEAAVGHPIDPKIEGYIHFVGLMLMLGLVITVTFNDIFRLIGNAV